ncbi:MauE/DoxX family redox-associated membrane protein [Spirillospora albida]|uniref:MauE/DoxX family redox-associated membrane protein n=1 Tax=Spirillospora albida TaxID=58123 RepID=UPI00068F9241|nr:MauE/DoxX family redox-associated membrane protein [Spirillospora albida]
MTALLAGAAAVAIPLVLLASLAGHLRRPRALAGALRAQRTLPAVLVRPVAASVLLAEAVTGSAGLAGLVLWRETPALWAAAALLGIYAAYGTWVARTRHGVPCGCAGDPGTPMTGWVAARAAALAALALAGASGGLPSTAYETSVSTIAGLTFAVLLWTLPHAMTHERTLAG